MYCLSNNNTLGNVITGLALLGATKIVVDKAFPSKKRRKNKKKRR